MERENANICPYCGQAVCADNGQDAREVCSCPGADEWRSRNDTFDRMRLAIYRLFGEHCGLLEPSWKPIDEESYAFLIECAERVVFVDGVEALSIKLADGSTAHSRPGHRLPRQKVHRSTRRPSDHFPSRGNRRRSPDGSRQ